MCRNRANKKWNLLERSNVRKAIEAYKSVEKYFSDKKQQVTSAFTYNPLEVDSQSKGPLCNSIVNDGISL